MKRRVLGKGLEALIPRKEGPQTLRGYSYINIERLEPSPYQSRINIPKQELKELAESINRQGVIQPLIVRKKGEKYEIIAGSRRYYACKSLGINELPAIPRELNDEEALVFSMIENLQRQDLNPLEEAQCYKRLVEEFMLSYDQISQTVGKNRTTVINSLRLLRLPEEIKEGLKRSLISASQARTLLGLKSEREQLDCYEELIKNRVSVRSLEETVRLRKNKKKPIDPYVREVENNLQKILGRKVKIISRGKKGKCVIEYYSNDDLEDLVKQLSKGAR